MDRKDLSKSFDFEANTTEFSWTNAYACANAALLAFGWNPLLSYLVYKDSERSSNSGLAGIAALLVSLTALFTLSEWDRKTPDSY